MVNGAPTPEAPSASCPVREPHRPFSSGALTARLRGDERGTALVEFALVGPLLFLLVFGIIDFGRALNYYNNLTQLAGQGARAAAVNRNPDGSAVGAATDPSCSGASTHSIQCELANVYTNTIQLKNGISVCITGPVPAAIGSPVTVRATYSYRFFGLVGGVNIRLSATQTERSEVPTPAYAPGDQVGNTSGAACTA
jgi:hypothetical protein